MRGAEITNLHVSDPSDTDNPLQIDYDFSAANYFDWSANRAYPSAAHQQPLRLPPADEADKDEPYRLGPPQEVQAEASINIPIKYMVKLPIGVDVKRDYAEYHSSYKVLNNELVTSRALKTSISEIPYDRQADYAAFVRVVDSDQEQLIRLENQSPGVSGSAGGARRMTGSSRAFKRSITGITMRRYGFSSGCKKPIPITKTSGNTWAALTWRPIRPRRR